MREDSTLTIEQRPASTDLPVVKMTRVLPGRWNNGGHYGCAVKYSPLGERK